MKTISLAALFSGLISVSVAAQKPAATAFIDVSVLPMDRERVISHQTVVVRGSRIATMGPANTITVPATAVHVDGRGKFLLPGLADMHAHIGLPREIMPAAGMDLAKQGLTRYVAEGVTTIRLMRGYHWGLDLKEQAARGAIVSPRMYVAVGPYPPYEGGGNPDSAVRAIEAAKRSGFDLLKFWSTVPGPAFDSIVATAHRVGLPIAGHAYDNRQAIQLGYVSVEHLLGLYDQKNDDSLHAMAAALRRAGVWVCPTLFHMVNHIDNVDRTTAYHVIKVLHDDGVKVLLGTDGGFDLVPQDFAYAELETLVQAGLTPYDALVTGTRNAAEYFGTLDSVGTVAPGKRADLLLLSGNPIEDIRYTQQPAGTMVNGHWYPQATLDQLLAQLPDRAELLRRIP